MTLEGVNAFFSSVDEVTIGWHKLQFVLVLMNNDVLQLLGAFIVHLVDGWTESLLFQVAKNILVYSDVFSNRAVFHGV